MKEKTDSLVGYVETDSGSILITDGVWDKTVIPLNTQQRVSLDLGLDRCRIPVHRVTLGGKKFLMIALDDAAPLTEGEDKIETEDPVKLPEGEKEEEEETEDA